MFIRAFGLALESRGYQVGFARSGLIIEGTHREYSLSIFGELTDGDLKVPILTERSNQYDAQALLPPPDCTMVGYWQSEKYFADIADKVRKAFTFPRPTLRHDSPTIALHIRRQDYVGLQHFHGLPTLDYYRAAVEYILTKMGGPAMVFVFSDDGQWCRKNLPSDFRVVERTTKYEDLQMMAECTHIMTANSSFSWWAAWLGETNPERIVVAPKRWFADPSMIDTDLVPERWIRL
jgi:hypothetical protein